MVIGMLLGSLAFVIAGVVQFKVQAGDKTLKAGESKLVVFNALPYQVDFDVEQIQNLKNFTLPPGENQVFGAQAFSPGNYTLNVGSEAAYPFELMERSITQIVVATHTNGTITFITDIQEDLKPGGGDSSVQIFNAFNGSTEFGVILTAGSGEDTTCSHDEFDSSELIFMSVSNRSNVTVGNYKYVIYTNKTENETYDIIATDNVGTEFKSGAVYTVVITENRDNVSSLADGFKVSSIEVDEPNSVSIFLQVPMYVIITAGEVMFSITGLEFAYSQAPVSMKAMCQAAWLLTVAFGNLVVIIVAESSLFADRAIEFFFFAALIFVVTIVFAIMSFFYKYVELRDEEDDETKYPSTGSSPTDGRGHDESTALVGNGIGGGVEERKAAYTESEGDTFLDKDGLASRSESEF